MNVLYCVQILGAFIIATVALFGGWEKRNIRCSRVQEWKIPGWDRERNYARQ